MILTRTLDDDLMAYDEMNALVVTLDRYTCPE